jgi:hypothetical protein
MRFRTTALLLEAVASAGACTAALVYGFPVLLSFGIDTLLEKPFPGAMALLQLAGSAWALIEFWRLALSTAFAVHYQFGWRFWLAVFGASGGMFAFVGEIPPVVLFALVGLPALAAAHFSYLQLAERNSAAGS